MLRDTVVSYPIIETSFSIFCTLFIIYILEHTYCACVCEPATVLSMGTKFVNKEEIVSGTRCENTSDYTSFLTASVHNENV